MLKKGGPTVRSSKNYVKRGELTFQAPNQKLCLFQDPSSLPKKHSSRWEQSS